MNRIFVRAAHSAAARKALLEKIIRVDHAGELGADRIYAGQMAVLKGTFPIDIVHGLRSSCMLQ
ncbi:unnamed protein product [Heligmosomoides polygyrus]|uniref:Acyl-CoA_dh_1 domain-containing protein n=1 Tax=Heligmosomoides polygyrus TaxID=6339 RepID=A0A183GQ20_HELPZ|nr:unnamed protein product [Heligmosomoides polygyrus]